MTQEEKGKVKVDTVVGMINGGMAAATGTMLVRKAISSAAVKTAAGAAARTVASATAGTLGRTAVATTLAAAASPAVVTALTVGSVLFGIVSIVKAFNN